MNSPPWHLQASQSVYIIHIHIRMTIYWFFCCLVTAAGTTPAAVHLLQGQAAAASQLVKYHSQLPPTTNPTLSSAVRCYHHRYYSISSSPLARPGTCSITVGKVSFTTATGRHHLGAASATIAATAVGGRLMGSVRRLSSSFRLPKDPSMPVIMIGPGG